MRDVFWIGIVFVVMGLLLCWRDKPVGIVSVFTGSLVLIVFILVACMEMAMARDDGRYAASPMKPWFDSLRSNKGPCCSDADGNVLQDADWKSESGHYRVKIEDDWYDVPDDAVLTQPNLFGKTVVWPVITRGFGGKKVDIRCFIPGAMI